MSSNDSQKLPLIELFGPTVQGEGEVIGQQTMFVRLGGCDYRCKMCDSMHAVDKDEIRKNATYVTQEELVQMTLDRTPDHIKWITLSGGNPALWDLSTYVGKLTDEYKRFAIETQGTYYKDWMRRCEVITVSPKGPGMGEHCDRSVLKKHIDFFRPHSGLNLKVVAFNDGDLDFAEELAEEYWYLPLYISLGNPILPGTYIGKDEHRKMLLDRYSWLCEDVMKRPKLGYAIVLPQLHVLTWSNEQGR